MRRCAWIGRVGSTGLVAVVALGLLSAAVGQQAGVRRLVVGTSLSLTLHSLPAIAAAKGLDKLEGLQLDIRMFPSGAAMTEAIATGEIKVAQIGDVPFVSMLAAGVPVRLVAQMTDSGRNYTFWVRRELEVRRAEDLLDKTIGFPFGSTSQLIMMEFIRVYRLDGRRIRVVDLGPAGVVAAYARGDLDGFILWSPGSNQAARVRASTKIHDAYFSYLIERPGPRRLGPAHTVIVAREEVLRSDRSVVEAYLRTILRARDFLYSRTTAAEAEQLIAEALRIETGIVREALPEIRFQLDLDSRLMGDLERVARALYELGRITRMPRVRDVTDAGPLRKVAPGLVKLE